MQSSNVSIRVDGQPMPCYLARPDGDQPRPAVIVLQEIFGVNAEVKRIADLLADAGYVALAPNYYYRTHPDLDVPYTPEGMQVGFAAAKAVTKATLKTDLAAARDWLDAQDFVSFDRIATWGFCFGGTTAFLSATLPGIAGAVCFYGGSIGSPLPSGEEEALADVADIKAPLLLMFGGKDTYIPNETVKRIEAELSAHGKRFEIQLYPEMDHGFFRESSAALDTKDVSDAWERVQAFLTRTLH